MASRKDYREYVRGRKESNQLREMGYMDFGDGGVREIPDELKGIVKPRPILSYREWAEDARDELSFGIEHVRSPIQEAEYEFLKKDEKRLKTQRRRAEMSKRFW